MSILREFFVNGYQLLSKPWKAPGLGTIIVIFSIHSLFLSSAHAYNLCSLIFKTKKVQTYEIGTVKHTGTYDKQRRKIIKQLVQRSGARTKDGVTLYAEYGAILFTFKDGRTKSIFFTSKQPDKILGPHLLIPFEKTIYTANYNKDEIINVEIFHTHPGDLNPNLTAMFLSKADIRIAYNLKVDLKFKYGVVGYGDIPVSIAAISLKDSFFLNRAWVHSSHEVQIPKFEDISEFQFISEVIYKHF